MRFSDQELETIIVEAIRAHDFEAVEASVVALMRQNPARGVEVFDVMRAAVMVAGVE